MKTKAICSLFVLFALAAVVVGTTTTPAAFADHPEVTIDTVDGSGFGQDCAVSNGGSGCYAPMEATIDVGGAVIMVNSDPTGAAHSFTSGTVAGFSPSPDGIFDSGLLNQDESFEWSPDTVGEYPYYCFLHTWMVGTIIVQEAEAEDDAHGDDAMDDAHGDDAMDDAHGDDAMDDAHGDDAMDDAHGDESDMMQMDGDATATGMLSDGTMVSIWTTEATAGEAMEIAIEFADREHVNHDIVVMQNGENVLPDGNGAHHHDGTGIHETAPLGSSDPVDITITFQGYGVDDPKTGPIGEEVVFSNVVPEFGTIAMMILAVAIISIVAVTAKSRVIPRF